MWIMLLGLALFLGIHLVPVFPNMRAGLVQRLGANRYRGIFSIFSAIGLALIIIGYRLRPFRPGCRRRCAQRCSFFHRNESRTSFHRLHE